MLDDIGQAVSHPFEAQLNNSDPLTVTGHRYPQQTQLRSEINYHQRQAHRNFRGGDGEHDGKGHGVVDSEARGRRPPRQAALLVSRFGAERRDGLDAVSRHQSLRL